MLNIIIAFLTGILSSMGFGGGTLLMIYLTQICGYDVSSAISINYLYYIPCAVLSVVMYLKSQMICLKPAIFLCIGAIIGSIIGVVISSHIDSNAIKNTFATFIVAAGVKELFF